MIIMIILTWNNQNRTTKFYWSNSNWMFLTLPAQIHMLVFCGIFQYYHKQFLVIDNFLDGLCFRQADGISIGREEITAIGCSVNLLFSTSEPANR